MAKPTETFTWATDPGATVLEPLIGEKAAGFAIGPGNKPRASWMNYLFRTVGQWISWLDGLAGEAFTWTALHTFAGGVYVSEGDLEVDGTVTAGAIVTPNTVAAKNTAKAMGIIQTTHATPLRAGFGASAAVSNAAGYVDVTLAPAMASTQYAVHASAAFPGGGVQVNYSILSASVVRFYFRDMADAVVNVVTTGMVFTFSVYEF